MPEIAVGILACQRPGFTLRPVGESASRCWAPLHIYAEPDTPQLVDDRVVWHGANERQGMRRNLVRALRDLYASGSPWVLILEDDTEVCAAAGRIIGESLDAWPQTDLLSLYTPGVAARRPQAVGWSIFQPGFDAWGTQAVCWRREFLERFLAECDKIQCMTPEMSESDQVVFGFANQRGATVRFHNPSLVQHLNFNAKSDHAMHLGHGYRADLAIRLAPDGRPAGWFSDDDARLYCREVAALPPDSVVVEVGVYCGRSLSYIAPICREKNHALYAVDPFTGIAPGVPQFVIRDALEQNLEALGLRDVVRIVAEPSASAAEYFADESVGLVMIDGRHDRASVMWDLRAWWPKLRSGGALLGHDFGDPNVQSVLRDCFGAPDVVEGDVYVIRKTLTRHAAG
jgi:hypothetical protein